MTGRPLFVYTDLMNRQNQPAERRLHPSAEKGEDFSPVAPIGGSAVSLEINATFAAVSLCLYFANRID